MPDFFQTGEFYSLLVAFVWACGVILFRHTGRTVPPVPLNLFKGAVALALLFPTLLLWGVPWFPTDRTAADWALLLASGVVGIAIADSLFFAGLNRLGAARSAVVDCLYSPSVVLCAVVFLGEPFTPVLGIALALMVTAVLLGAWTAPVDDVPADSARDQRAGVAYAVMGVVLMAVGITLAKPVLNQPGSSVLWVTTVRLAGATVFLAVQGLLGSQRAVVQRIFTPSREWKLLIPASFVGTYLAMVIWLAGMKYTHASISAVLNQTSTLFIPLLGWVFLREPLTRRIGVAILLGFTGAVLLGLIPPHLEDALRAGLGAGR